MMHRHGLDILIIAAAVLGIILWIGYRDADHDLTERTTGHRIDAHPEESRTRLNAAAVDRYTVSPDRDLAEIINEKLVAERLDGTVIELSPGDVRATAGIEHHSASLRLSPVPGTALSRLLNRLEQAEPYCLIESLHLTRIRDNSGAMDITLTISVFSRRR